MSGEEDAKPNDAQPIQGDPEPNLTPAPVVEATADDTALGKKAQGQSKPKDHQGTGKPSPFDRDLAQTDRTIKRFTVVSGLAAVVSACAAIYTASQLAGSGRQMDNAIANIAADASASRDQANALGNEVGAVRDEDNRIGEEVEGIRSEASATENLVGPANTTAQASVRSVRQQADQFFLEQRPIIDFSRVPADIYDQPSYDSDKKLFFWNYANKNYGRSIATNISYVEDLSVFGLPFARQERPRGVLARGRLVPTGDRWSSAYYPFPISPKIIVPSNIRLIPFVMRIAVRYNDLSGHPYEDDLCSSSNPNGTFGNCLYHAYDGLGIDPRSYIYQSNPANDK